MGKCEVGKRKERKGKEGIVGLGLWSGVDDKWGWSGFGEWN